MIVSYLRVSSDEQREAADHRNAAQRNRPLLRTKRDNRRARVRGRWRIRHDPARQTTSKPQTLGSGEAWRCQPIVGVSSGSVSWARPYRHISTLAKLLKLKVDVTSIKEGRVENNASGWLNTSIHASFAAYERASIVERSMDATLRLAKNGVWLGGIVPYGYRVQGQDREARLMLSESPIPGCERWTAVTVIRRIYTMAAAGKSCFAISDDLARLGIPPTLPRMKKASSAGKKTKKR